MANNDGPPAKSDFTFINVSSTHLRGNDETRKRVRSHAQADYRRRTSNRSLSTTIELDTSSLISGAERDTSLQAEGAPPGGQLPSLMAPGPSTMLDANRRDPFGTFDIGNSRRAHFLWDHAYEGSCPKFRALNDMGFMDLARETIALPGLLSAAAWHLVHSLHHEDDQGEDAKFSLRTMQSLRQRLDNPLTSTSDEVVITVLAFVAYSNLTRDPESFNVHLNGLRQIFHCRAGDGFTDSSSAIRLALLWIETHGRFRADSAPEFPQPIDLLAQKSQLSFPLPALDRYLESGSKEDFIEDAIVTQTWDVLQHLNKIITKELSTRRDLWHDISFAVYHLSPILHSLLTIPRASIHDNLPLRQRECFRLGCILYIANLQHKFDSETGIGMLYGSKLKMMLDEEDIVVAWERSKSTFIWILTVAASSPCMFAELRSYFAGRLGEALRASEGAPMQAISDVFEGAPWYREVFQEEMTALIGQLELHE